MSQAVELSLVHGDIVETSADVILLKYAQAFYGADHVVADRLNNVGIQLGNLMPNQGKYSYVAAQGAVKAGHVLFVGVPRLSEFRYPQLRQFSAAALGILKREEPLTSHLAMTIHGPGNGLDETEAFFSLIQGIEDGLRDNEIPTSLTRITVVDRNLGRVQRLRSALETSINKFESVTLLSNGNFRLAVLPLVSPGASRQSGPRDTNLSAAKSHVFVAMPFSTHLDDIFHYGIQAPVHNAGYLCERMDHSAFTGGIVEAIKKSIDTSAVVIAEISEPNPNVFLEVGYAWGRNRPTILLSATVDDLPFDVRGQKCLQYKGIKHLEDLLKHELLELRARSII